MAIPAARKVNTPQAVACRFPRRLPRAHRRVLSTLSTPARVRTRDPAPVVVLAVTQPAHTWSTQSQWAGRSTRRSRRAGPSTPRGDPHPALSRCPQTTTLEGSCVPEWVVRRPEVALPTLAQTGVAPRQRALAVVLAPSGRSACLGGVITACRVDRSGGLRLLLPPPRSPAISDAERDRGVEKPPNRSNRPAASRESANPTQRQLRLHLWSDDLGH
jgi:hypothetical protein